MSNLIVRRAAMIGAAAYTLALSGPLAANEIEEARMQATPAASDPAATPQLKSIDRPILYRRMMQLGMLTQVLGYKLSVDTEGKPVECSFSRSFKSAYTAKRLCAAFIETVEFEPARDETGKSVTGTYEGEIEIASFFQPSR
ncbi:MAG: hypothetical protein NBV60_05565 [Erythrobacter sp.]|nr:hypothetical protein [Erythrobacter sp.]